MMYKYVNGERVLVSVAEETTIRAEWAANDAAPDPIPKRVTPFQLMQALIELGWWDEFNTNAQSEAAPGITFMEMFRVANSVEYASPRVDQMMATRPDPAADKETLFRLAATK